MKNKEFLKKSVLWAGLAAAVVSAVGLFYPPQSLAQVPARFYWKNLSGGNGVLTIFESISGNTNPFDPSHMVTAGAEFDATLALLGYAHNFSLFDRSATAAVIMPMGRASGEVTVAGSSAKQSASGFGDPMLEFVVNLLGPPAQKNIPDAMRYEPGFSVDFLADLYLPIGEYNNDQPLNISQNRWYGRIGMPIVWQLGPWVPGRRTTLEFLPVMWVFGDNDDYVGQTLESDLLFQLDAHLTRDLTERLWGSLDAAVYNGGAATINDGVPGEELNNFAMGVTLGYGINENLNLTFSYKSTLNDDAPDDMKMDVFMVTLVFGWHPLMEGFRKLESSN
ncbi:MAG: transporter [Desulfobulbaceae bacterium]|nr:MAG: transporter [Desulfobulbaceae bacterium]